MTGYNPYQPPAHDEVPWAGPDTATGETGEPLAWDIGAALSVGWDRVKLWWPVMIFGPVVVGIIQQTVSGVLGEILERVDGPLALLVSVFTLGVSLLMSSFFGVGLMRAFIGAARAEEPQFATIFSGADRMWALLGTQVLYGLAVTAGFIALFVPGIILALGLAQAPWLCVDEGLAPVDALKRSWEIMKGSKAQLFGYGLVGMLLVIAGVLALFVGMFVAIAVLYAGTAWIYLRRRGETVPDRFGQN